MMSFLKSQNFLKTKNFPPSPRIPSSVKFFKRPTPLVLSFINTSGSTPCKSLKAAMSGSVREIPEKYILKRWMRHAKSRAEDEVASTKNLTDVQEIDKLCSDFMRMVYRTIGNVKAREIIRDMLKSMEAKLDEIGMPKAGNVEGENEEFQPINKCFDIKAKGLAKKYIALGGKRRKKAWHDKTNVSKNQQQMKKMANIIAKRLTDHGSSSQPTKDGTCSQENLSIMGSKGVGDDELTLTL